MQLGTPPRRAFIECVPGSHWTFAGNSKIDVSAGRLVYSLYRNLLFPSLGQKKAFEGVFEGGSHFDEKENWLPPVSAGQSIYSPYQMHLLPIAGYQGGSHFLATNWLPAETEV